MKYRKAISFIFLLCSLPCLPFLSSAQDTDSSEVNLHDDWEYLSKAREHYQEWLESNSELSKVISVTDLHVVESDLAVLDLEIISGADWVELRDKYAESNSTTLSRMLFNKFLFLAELDREQAGIRIRSAKKDFYVDMRYKDGELLVYQSKLRGDKEGSITIDSKKLPKSLKVDGLSTVEATKNRLVKYFDNYYSSRDGWFNDSKFKVLDDEEKDDIHYVEFLVYNIRDEVLDDFTIGYHERITINMTVKENEGKIIVLYQIQAKYGAGIFSAPRRTDYVDVEIKHKEYLEQYTKAFKTKIQAAIKK